MRISRDQIKLFKNGDLLAFDAIYKKFSHQLYNFVYRFLKQDEDTEEIIQEVFIKLWETRSKIDVNSSFESYLFTITYNSTISLLRKRVHETKYVEYIKSIQNQSEGDEIYNWLQYDEINLKCTELFKKLTPRQKEIFVLSRYEGLSHKEIAQKLEISTNTVKNHLVSTLNFFKANLKPYHHAG